MTSLAAVVALSAGLLVPAAAANAAPAATAACTDGASTAYSATVFGTTADLRQSGNCGGAFWFRLNGWNGSNAGTFQIQFKNSAGTIVNGSKAMNQDAPYISPYSTGYKYARVTFNNGAGSKYNFTGPWKPYEINAR